ncbi:MAG: lipid biosynthesis B12-binding/radical SAM protein [Betaproteobacteria bacterium]
MERIPSGAILLATAVMSFFPGTQFDPVGWTSTTRISNPLSRLLINPISFHRNTLDSTTQSHFDLMHKRLPFHGVRYTSALSTAFLYGLPAPKDSLKVLLISANQQTTPYPVYPIGLDYVAGAISSQHQVKILDLNLDQGASSLSASILEFSPDLVGISLRNIDNTDGANSIGFIEGYQKLIAAIRSTCKAPIALGGSGFTIFPEILMEKLGADFGIPGDGEQIGLLLEAMEDKAQITSIPGIFVRGNAITEKATTLSRPINRLFDAQSSHLHFYLTRSSMMNLQTKRGCPFRCIYCTYPQIDGSQLRLHDPAEVAQTALELQNAGAKYFFISDSTFNSSISHSVAVAKAFIKAGLSIPWGAFFAPLSVPEDYFKLMAEAGLTHVEFGTESLSDSMLASYKKPFTHQDVFLAHQRALDAGLHVAHYIMPGGPGESEQTLDETLSRLESLKKSAFFFFCGIRIYPHTAIYDTALQEGQITKDQDLLTPVYYQSGNLSNKLIEARITSKAAGRTHWVIGSGGKTVQRMMSRMYANGHVGPLWEHIIP